MYKCPECNKEFKARGKHNHRIHDYTFPTFTVSGESSSNGVKLTVVENPADVKVNLGEFYVNSKPQCSCVSYAGQSDSCLIHKHASACSMCGAPHKYITVDKAGCNLCAQVAVR